MSILWSGLTEAGAIVPVQVDDTGRVIAISNNEGGSYWEKSDNTLKPTGGENVFVDGTISSVSFLGSTASFTQDVVVNSLSLGRGGGDIESNTALGVSALSSNSTGNENTALGRYSLFSNSEGYSNTALGRYSLYTNTEGFSNTALGRGALIDNATGSYNTALGVSALSSNSTGNNNTAVGLSALRSNITGNNNTFIGENPGLEGLNDTVCISAGTQERLWIDSEGQAGIGTNNPQAKLDVAGPALFANGLCGFLPTGEIFFQSRNTAYKLVVSSNGLVSAEPVPTAMLGLEDRKELVIPAVIETNAEKPLPITIMDNHNA